jgi:cardiolipin synthase
MQLASHLAAAARRGTKVRVTTDGYDTPSLSERILGPLHEAGVELDSFDPQPTFFRIRTNLLCRLHRKIAVIDHRTAFVGSSNLDPTSLGLNYEANLFVLDRTFNAALRNRLDRLMDGACEAFVRASPRASRLRRLLAALSYHLTRRMSTWGRRTVRRPQRKRPI